MRAALCPPSDEILTGAGGGSSCPPSSRAPATAASTAAITHTTIVERELSGTRRTYEPSAYMWVISVTSR